MSSKTLWLVVAFVGGALVGGGTPVLAQMGQNPTGTQNPATQQPGQNRSQSQKQAGNSLDIPTANSDDAAAAKAFQQMPNTDLQKKIAAGEEFLQKYPDSQFRPVIYSGLTFDYLLSGNAPKAVETGEKEVALKPDDVQTLALLGQTIPRAINANTAEPTKQLDKAEGYAKRAIEVTPTITKPEGMPDQNFIAAKNGTLAMAHSGLGLVYFRRGKFNDAIPELEQSVKIDPNPTPDPVNLYLLGLSNQKASHFDEAAAAFNKCAEIHSGLQTACKNGADESKKQAGTQLSAPK